MGYTKADEFFKVYSGPVIDDIQAYIEQEKLELNLIGWKLVSATNILEGATTGWIKVVQVFMIDNQGINHETTIPLHEGYTIIYNPLPKEVT